MARTEVKLDKGLFETCFYEARGVTTKGLEEVVANMYNERRLKTFQPITKSIVRLRATKWGMYGESVGKGKKSLEINKALFVKTINEVEKDGGLNNLGDLWKKVAEVYNLNKSNTSPPITFSVVGLRIKEWKIEVKTKPGKRGNGLALARANGTVFTRRKSADKFKDFEETFRLMRIKFPERFHPLIDRYEKGEKRFGIILNCIECNGFQTSGISDCVCVGCPLYPSRPYQKKDDKDELIGLPVEDSVEEMEEELV